MKKVFILLSILAISCAIKEVKIPTLAIKGIQEVQNHSQVWIFFEIKNNDTIANINKKNTISSTHWIYNIDKRLPLKSFIPSLISLQYKHANSMHSEKGMHDYFSYSDTISKKLSFIAFDTIQFKTDSLVSKSYIKKHSENYLSFNNLNLTFETNQYWINDSLIEINDFKSTLEEFIDFSSEGKPTLLHLNFNQDLQYQQYLEIKAMINSLVSKSILINPIEFIYNKNKVPDCGCNKIDKT